MKQNLLLLSCILSITLFCSGCISKSDSSSHTTAGEEMNQGTVMHAEFLVAAAEEHRYTLKYITGDIPEDFISSGEVRSCDALMPEDFSFQLGDHIEADYYFPDVPPNVIPYLDIEKVKLLSEATDDTLQEALDFQDQYLLTEEAWERRNEAILNEAPIPIPADADWVEIAFYGLEQPQNYKFTDPSAISYIHGLLHTDSWQNNLNGFAGLPSEYVYAGKDDSRYIIEIYDVTGTLGFQVNLIKGEEDTFTRSYLVEDLRYVDFIQSLEEICL